MSRPLLKVESLSVAFNTQDEPQTVVDQVSFSIDRGETLALVGESGSGKSVTALSVLRLLPYPTAFHPCGSVALFDGEHKTELMSCSEDTLRSIRGNKISMIFQEPITSLNPLQTVGKQVGEVLEIHRGIRRDVARLRALSLLEKVGIQNAAERIDDYPHQFSGGQRQRVMIALALANEPDLLIADEPTTALDVTVQAQILSLLKELQQEFGMALLLITHDLSIVRRVADRVCVMTEGRIVESGGVGAIFEHPKNSYTKKLLSAEPKKREVQSIPDGSPVIDAEGLKVWFPIRRGVLRRTVDHVKAVDDVTLSIGKGRTLGVVGESGSGKTTLGRALLRLMKSEGAINYKGRDLSILPERALRPLRRDLQIVFQDPFSSLNPRLSVRQIIEEGLKVHSAIITTGGLTALDRRVRVDRIIDEVGLSREASEKFPHEFSGGQRQRIAIARAMVLNPQFVVLDEPTSALDMTVQTQIVDLLLDIQKRHQVTYMFISHDLRIVRALCDEVMVMKDGCIVERGATEQIFTDPQTEYTRTLIDAALDLVA